MSIRGSEVEIRRETVTANSRSHDAFYYYDSRNDVWLSCTEVVLPFGHPSLTATGTYLNGTGGVIMSAASGYYLPFPFAVVWLSWKVAATTSPDASIQITTGGSTVIHTETLSTTEGYSTPFATASADFVDIKWVKGGANMTNLIVDLGIRWRLS